MRGLGQIAALADIARPSIGVITNVGPAHLERVGSLEPSPRRRASSWLRCRRAALRSCPTTFQWTRDDIEVVRRGQPDAMAENGTTRAALRGPRVTFSFRGRHQAENALERASRGDERSARRTGRVDVDFSRWRGEEIPLPGGGCS